MGEQSPNVAWHPGMVHRAERARLTGSGRGATVWFTGLSGSGKSSVAVEVERALLEAGRLAYLLDGDNLRHGLNGDLGFNAEDRDENVRRVAHVARLFADAGVVALTPLVSPYRNGRDQARLIHAEAGIDFVEVYVNTPIEECERRDVKGLYAKARRGELTGMTGVDDPYEPPEHPELELTPDMGGPAQLAAVVLTRLRANAIL